MKASSKLTSANNGGVIGQILIKTISRLSIANTLVILVVILIGVGFMGKEGSAHSAGEDVVYYFWGYCPVCSKPEEHVHLFDDYPVEVLIYEVFQDKTGRGEYDRISAEVGIDVYGFPTVVFRDRYWLGFSASVQQDITATLDAAYRDHDAPERENIIVLPLVGEIDLLDSPIFLTTAIIAFLDGFNPCSLFVLTFLLAIIVHSASRKRIFLVGITFLIITASVYGLFMLGILNIMIFASQLFWIRNVVAAIVIVLGLAGIKDFIIFKDGPSFAIPDSYKSKYYRQVRNVFYTSSFLPMVGATAVMALGIALVELPCTAGFPFIWSTVISGLDLSRSAFVSLFTLYILIYLSVELVIFFAAVIRMRSIKMTEERGRLLKLVAGSLMFVLGLILLLRPDYMENILGIVATFGSAALLTLVIYAGRMLYRRISGKTT